MLLFAFFLRTRGMHTACFVGVQTQWYTRRVHINMYVSTSLLVHDGRFLGGSPPLPSIAYATHHKQKHFHFQGGRGRLHTAALPQHSIDFHDIVNSNLRKADMADALLVYYSSSVAICKTL